jgi:acetoacetate decarboxylase
VECLVAPTFLLKIVRHADCGPGICMFARIMLRRVF